MDLISPDLALGILLLLVGIGGLLFGIYAITRGGKDAGSGDSAEGGIGPLPERGIHAIAGIRMLVGGLVAAVLGVLLLISYFG